MTFLKESLADSGLYINKQTKFKI